MKSRLVVLLLITLVVTLAYGRVLQADSTEIWNTGNVTTISHNNFSQIKGNYLVWQGRGGLDISTSGSSDWEIFYIDIDNKVVVQLTDDDYDDISPQTDGVYVVWQKHDTSRSNQIFLYKIGEYLPGGSMISNNDSRDNYSPRIAAGRIVWTSQRVAQSVEPGEIMLYDAKNHSGPNPISDTTLDSSSPRINSETVIWVQSDGIGAAAQFMYDLTSENPVPEAAPEYYVWPNSPQTDGDLTVLTLHDGSDREISVYNNSTKTYEQITDNVLDDTYPRFSGGYVAWVAGDGEASEIFLAALGPCATSGGDIDVDGICGNVDNCPDTHNPEQADVDVDGIGDLCDSCDNRPITGSVTPSIDTLWPPNHSMIPVSIDASALVPHNPNTQVGITSVAVSEYSSQEAGEVYDDNIYDENNFEPDWEITGDLTLNLRSERDAASTGRTYTITVTASDCSGDYVISTEVVVPHDKGK